MASLSLNSYLFRVNEAWEKGDGQTLADFLSFSDTHIANSKLQVSSITGEQEARSVAHLHSFFADLDPYARNQEILIQCSFGSLSYQRFKKDFFFLLTLAYFTKNSG